MLTFIPSPRKGLETSLFLGEGYIVAELNKAGAP